MTNLKTDGTGIFFPANMAFFNYVIFFPEIQFLKIAKEAIF